MKTWTLDRISSVEEGRAALAVILPESNSTWLLLARDGDAIAYFSVVEGDIDLVGPAITADVSGRHYREDAAVVAVLKELRKKVGGVIVSDA